MSVIEFEAWPKIPRLNRSITISEKLDGTNAAVVIAPATGGEPYGPDAIAVVPTPIRRERGEGDHAVVYAQSRTRFITPKNDNYGFAGWVEKNAEGLVALLGEGRHFGEWWGAGIQRKYGLTGNDKRFSLFNTARHAKDDALLGTNAYADVVPGLGVVPVLYQGPFGEGYIQNQLETLRNYGSFAEPGFMSPEGIVVYHQAARQSFKVTLEGDEAPKGVAGHAKDVELAA